MRILLVGATGLLGTALQAVLSDHEILRSSRSTDDHRLDITDHASIGRLLPTLGQLDAVICVAGTAPFLPWAQAGQVEWAAGVASKLMGQVHLIRAAAAVLPVGGRIIVTSGQLAQHPVTGSSIVTTVNAAVEAFVRSAAVECPELRVNAVSPGWIRETLVALGRNPERGIPARTVAAAYAGLLESDASGTVVIP